jgi:hypothetical protein
MANSGRLEVEIGADVSGLEQGISQAERQLRTLESRRDARIRIGADTTEIDRRISGVNTRLNELRTSAQGAQTAMRGMTGQVGNGSNALMQFSRIAQDAPFGIIGVGNNLTATAEAFGHLRNQTGSASGALRAMASSLMGTGGILLGVSLLTTGFTILAQKGLTVGDVIDKITGNFDDFGASVKKASEEAVKNSAGEILGLKSLIAVAQDETKAKKERLAAVEAIQSQYPGYFGNLSKENIMTADLTSTVNQLAQALINKEIANNLAKEAAPQLLALYKLNAVYKKQRKEYTESQAALKRIGYEQGETSTTYKEAEATMTGYYDAMEKTRGEIYKATDVNKRYENSITAINSSASKLLIKAPPKVAPPKTPKSPKVNPNAGNEFTPFLNPFQSSIVPPIELTFIDPTAGFLSFNAKAKVGLTTLEQAWQTTVGNIDNLMQDAIGAGIFNIGDAIGNSLINGDNVLQSAGGALLQTLGGFISSIAKEMIEFGVLTALFGSAKEAIEKAGVSGVVAIGAGLALAAIGAAISSSGNKVSQAAGGKGTSTSSGATANNTTRTSGGFSGGSGFGGGTVVFEIAGTSLIGVLNNTQARNLRIGGSN